MELCLQLGGMTVSEMLERMSSTEITWWRTLFEVKGDEQERDVARRKGSGGRQVSSTFT